MGRYDDSDDEGDGKKSAWNSAQLKVKRIDDWMITIGNMRVNPLAWNMDWNCYNWNVWITGTNIVYSEIKHLLDTEEKKYAEELKKNFEMLLEKYPVLIEKKKRYSESKSEIDYDNWKLIKKVLEKWQDLVLELHSEHGLDTSIYEQDDGL